MIDHQQSAGFDAVLTSATRRIRIANYIFCRNLGRAPPDLGKPDGHLDFRYAIEAWAIAISGIHISVISPCNCPIVAGAILTSIPRSSDSDDVGIPSNIPDYLTLGVWHRRGLRLCRQRKNRNNRTCRIFHSFTSLRVGSESPASATNEETTANFR